MSDPMSSYLIGNLAQTGVGLGLGIGNLVSQDYWNRQNLDFQRQSNAQNEALTREAWSRDDNAVQRRAQDLANAGLSPHLAAGSAAGVSNPIRNEPLRATAPQANFDQMIQGMGALSNIGKVRAETSQTLAQTELTRQQIEASKSQQQHLLAQEKHLGRQNALINQQLQTGSSVLQNMAHDMAYAQAHNLPVGKVEENQIRRIEFALEKIENLRQFFGQQPTTEGVLGGQVPVNPIAGVYQQAIELPKNIITNPLSVFTNAFENSLLGRGIKYLRDRIRGNE